MKEQLLQLIAEDKRHAVEPLIDKVLALYDGRVNLQESAGPTCSFSRIPTFDDALIKPSAAIFLSQNGNREAGLVHELLHLALPQATGFFLFGQLASGNDAFLNALNNTSEHDLFLTDFLAMGYSIDNFLFEGFNTIDYSQEGAEPAQWWKYEYHRIIMTKDHVGAAKSEEGNQAMSSIKQYGEQFHPGIANEFDQIDAWLNEKRRAMPVTHSEYMRKLSGLVIGDAPIFYAALNADNLLTQVSYQ